MRFLFIQILLTSFLISSGILRTDGRIIINENNEKVILKGFGLGGWLVLEGYMWNFPGFGSTTTMENAVIDLLGEQKDILKSLKPVKICFSGGLIHLTHRII